MRACATTLVVDSTRTAPMVSSLPSSCASRGSRRRVALAPSVRRTRRGDGLAWPLGRNERVTEAAERSLMFVSHSAVRNWRPAALRAFPAIGITRSRAGYAPHSDDAARIKNGTIRRCTLRAYNAFTQGPVGLLIYVAVAAVTMVIVRRRTAVSRTATAAVIGLPFCFTGRALLTGSVYAPIDAADLVEPL